MYKRADDWVQDARYCQRDGGEVQGHGEGQVQPYRPHHPPREAQEVGQLAYLVVHKGDVRGVYSDVAAHAAHGDAGAGSLEGGRVVDAVAYHADGQARCLGLVYPVQLVLGQALVFIQVYANFGGDGLGGVAVVSGEQDRLRTRLAHGGYGPCHVGAESVRESNKASRHAADGYVDHRAAPRAVFLGGGEQLPRRGSALGGQQLRVARQHPAALHDCADAPAGEHGEVLRLGRLRARALAPAGDDGLAQRMLAAGLDARRQAVELRLIQRCVKAADGGDLGAACRQCACFVEADAADLGQPLQRVALAHEKAVFRRVADGGHDGRRRRQHKGAGAEHDKYGDGADYLACDGPGDARRQQGRDHDPGGPAVRKADDLGLSGIRRLDKTYHALDGAVLTDF